jgi:hypothetical protein
MMKRKVPSGGYHPYTPPARTAEDDRTLLNWLSTRVEPNGLGCDADSAHERVLIENRLAYAKALGLQVQPSVHLAQGSVQLQKTSQELAFADFLVLRVRKRAGESRGAQTGGGCFDLHIYPPALSVLSAAGRSSSAWLPRRRFLVEGKQVVVQEPQARDRRFTRLWRILRPDQISIERLSRFLLALQHDAQCSQASAQLLGGHVGQITACQDPGGL